MSILPDKFDKKINKIENDFFYFKITEHKLAIKQFLLLASVHTFINTVHSYRAEFSISYQKV